MIRRALVYTVLLFTGFAVGYMLALPNPKPPAVPNTEQAVKATGALVDWLERNDTEALGYDYPNPLGCTPPKNPPWLRDGLQCVFGITYLDETTRRYTVVMDVNNAPLHVYRGKRSVAVPDPP